MGAWEALLFLSYNWPHDQKLKEKFGVVCVSFGCMTCEIDV